MEGFKQFKAAYNRKNAQSTCNDPRGTYPRAEDIYQTVKGPGCSQWSFNALGARGQLPSGSMLSTWKVLKQFAQLLPSG